MKKISLIVLVFFLVSNSLFQSCKYEEGPTLSLRTKKARISGTWNVEKITEEDGTIFTPNDNNSLKYTFNKSGTGDYIIILFGLSDSQTINWELANSKKNLKITYENGNIANTKILKLTNDELIVITNDGDRWELDKQ